MIPTRGRLVTGFRAQVALAVLAGLLLRLFFIWRFPTDAGDTRIYEELARNWLSFHVYGLLIGGHVAPVDIRAPGYPAFLAVVYLVIGRSRLAMLLSQAVVDLGTCILAAALAAALAPAQARRRVTLAALWLAATCAFLADYTAVALTETLATFLTTGALVILLRRGAGHEAVETREKNFAASNWRWLAGGFVTGLGTLVRPETPLLLAAFAVVLAVRWRHRADWPKLVRAGALLAAGLVVPLLPWGARNWITLHQAEFLAPRYAEMPGEFVPRGFYAWTKTWLVRLRDVYTTVWKYDDEPIDINQLPASAFDSPEERARVAALLEQYNETSDATPELDAAFAQLARERTARHPLRTYLRVPLERALTIWFTPRLEWLPYSGRLRPFYQQWDRDREDFLATLLFGFLNFLYAGLAVAGLWRAARAGDPRDAPDRWGIAILAAFIAIRTAFLTQVETPEPRYVMDCFPAVLALGALLWARRAPYRAPREPVPPRR